MAEVKNYKMPGRWAENAYTTIPQPPVTGLSYRNDELTEEEVNTGQRYGSLGDSATWNQLLWAMSGIAKSLEEQGALSWSPLIDYNAGALVMGTDDHLYTALKPSGPNTELVNPATEESEDMTWLDVTAKLIAKPFPQYEIGEFYYFRHPTMKPGFAPLQGGLISGAYQGKDITEYPIWEYLQTADGQLLLKTEAEWQAMTTAIWHTNADGTTVGWNGIGGAPYYVQDLGAGTLRMPDLRGMYAEAVGFDSLDVGGMQGDHGRRIWADQNLISGYDGLIHYTSQEPLGAFFKSTQSTRSVTGVNDTGYALGFDSDRVAPTGAAFAPRRWGALACCYLGRPA